MYGYFTEIKKYTNATRPSRLIHPGKEIIQRELSARYSDIRPLAQNLAESSPNLARIYLNQPYFDMPLNAA